MKNWDRPFWTKKSNNHIYDLIIPLPYSNVRYKHKICLDNCKNLSCVSDDNCDSEKKSSIIIITKKGVRKSQDVKVF